MKVFVFVLLSMPGVVVADYHRAMLLIQRPLLKALDAKEAFRNQLRREIMWMQKSTTLLKQEADSLAEVAKAGCPTDTTRPKPVANAVEAASVAAAKAVHAAAKMRTGGGGVGSSTAALKIPDLECVMKPATPPQAPFDPEAHKSRWGFPLLDSSGFVPLELALAISFALLLCGALIGALLARASSRAKTARAVARAQAFAQSVAEVEREAAEVSPNKRPLFTANTAAHRSASLKTVGTLLPQTTLTTSASEEQSGGAENNFLGPRSSNGISAPTLTSSSTYNVRKDTHTYIPTEHKQRHTHIYFLHDPLS
jgi:hypothetical protein